MLHVLFGILLVSVTARGELSVHPSVDRYLMGKREVVFAACGGIEQSKLLTATSSVYTVQPFRTCITSRNRTVSYCSQGECGLAMAFDHTLGSTAPPVVEAGKCPNGSSTTYVQQSPLMWCGGVPAVDDAFAQYGLQLIRAVLNGEQLPLGSVVRRDLLRATAWHVLRTWHRDVRSLKTALDAVLATVSDEWLLDHFAKRMVRLIRVLHAVLTVNGAHAHKGVLLLGQLQDRARVRTSFTALGWTHVK
jgi:hypothetical protein